MPAPASPEFDSAKWSDRPWQAILRELILGSEVGARQRICQVRQFRYAVSGIKLESISANSFRRHAEFLSPATDGPVKPDSDITTWLSLFFANRYNITSEADIRDAARKLEAKPVIYSSFTVGPETDTEKGKENARKPV